LKRCLRGMNREPATFVQTCLARWPGTGTGPARPLRVPRAARPL
jgi:hypothetical protein